VINISFSVENKVGEPPPKDKENGARKQSKQQNCFWHPAKECRDQCDGQVYRETRKSFDIVSMK